MMHHDWAEFEAYLQRKHNRNLTAMDYIRGLHELVSMNRSFMEYMANQMSGPAGKHAKESEN